MKNHSNNWESYHLREPEAIENWNHRKLKYRSEDVQLTQLLTLQYLMRTMVDALKTPVTFKRRYISGLDKLDSLLQHELRQ